MECWRVQPSSHDESVYAHSCGTSVRGTQLMAAGCDFAETKADIQNQLDGIVRNKAIYQKVATAMAELGYSCTWRRTKLLVAQRHKHRHENEIHLFSLCHMTVT